MSELWHVSVRATTDDTVELLCAAVHPDAGALPASKPFALRLLADAGPAWPGARDLGAEGDVYTDDGELTRRAERVLASVSSTDERNFPFDEPGARRRIEDGLRERGLSPEGSSWGEAFEDEWRALWLDPERVPSAVLHVRFADPSGLSGLRPGAEWDSAAYG